MIRASGARKGKKATGPNRAIIKKIFPSKLVEIAEERSAGFSGKVCSVVGTGEVKSLKKLLDSKAIIRTNADNKPIKNIYFKVFFGYLNSFFRNKMKA